MFSCIIFTFSSERNKWATWTEMSATCGQMSAYGVTWMAFYGKDTRFGLFQSVWAACQSNHSLLLGIWWDVINPGDRQDRESGTICVVARKKFILFTFPLHVEMHDLCPGFLSRPNVTLTRGCVHCNEYGIWVLRCGQGQVRDAPPEFEPGNSEVNY